MNTIVYILEKDDQDPCKTETKRELRKEKKIIKKTFYKKHYWINYKSCVLCQNYMAPHRLPNKDKCRQFLKIEKKEKITLLSLEDMT